MLSRYRQLIVVGIGLVLAAGCGSASAQATVTCGGQLATILGTPGKDGLSGTTGPDVIVGFGGNDRISGLGGDDIICPDQPDGGLPETGDDLVDAGAGGDVILSSPGADTLNGNGSSEGAFDAIDGGSGDDRIGDSGAGDVYVSTGEGTDRVSVDVTGEVDLEGGSNDSATVIAGHDLNIIFHGGTNHVTATVGGDINANTEAPTALEAKSFNELNFSGSPGNDTVVTRGSDNDGEVNLSLGDGDDTFRGAPGSISGFFNANAGPGDDTINVPAATSPIGEAAIDAGPGDDYIAGSPSNSTNYILGEAGKDTLKGGLGEDYLSGGEGQDTLDGREGPDWYSGEPGDDIIRARDGQADLYFDCGEGQDRLLADTVEDQSVNRSGCAENRFYIDIGGNALTTLLPATSVATYTWTPSESVAHEWLTAASGPRLTQRLAPQPGLAVGAAPDDGTPVVEVDPATRFQTIEGFGGAMTQAAASLLAKEPAGRRAQMVNALFSGSGAHLNQVRVPMGATDLSTDAYNYDPLPVGQTSDYDLEHFTVAHDEADVIPALRQARAANPELELMATPWSAPGWMKIGEHFIPNDCTGSLPFLKPEAYPAYAHYFLKFLLAYRDRGLPVSMVSLQNEPHNCNTHYPTMLMKPVDQAHLADELRPLLDANGFGATGILAWDHNWSENGSATTYYPQEAVELAEGTISAVGYHCYEADPVGPEAQSEFHELFPGVDVYFTECSGFYNHPNTAQNLVSEVQDDLIGPMNNWARTSLYWSLIQGTDGKPVLSTQGGCQTCRGMLAVDRETGKWTRSEDYYYWAQLSKFVKRGAERILSTHTVDRAVETTAFRNPDGSVVVVALNTSSG
ncbi:MAG TPA: glycoside hydrolase family 30 beta sandwich domain-containing protein [Solirubrobacterales bacterium]|nr:glycoside hydrolase family 30 beta sandwich domain-containing protein [Solirubrobacterales bacterium]